MNPLKRIPLSYAGELHEVRLVNFTVDMDEVRDLVPKELRIRNFGGRAMISLVNVSLEKMHPVFLPQNFCFHYRHVAFRLLLDDSVMNEGMCHGIYFLRSFSQSPVVAAGANMLTDYRMEAAEIRNLDRMMSLRRGDRYFNYALDTGAAITADQTQLEIIGALDRAYAVHEGAIRMVRIMREKWPLRPVECYLLETNFFSSAKPVSAFVIDQVIPYVWKAPQTISRAS